MARQKVEDNLLYLIFRQAPWWVSVAATVVAYCGLRFALPLALGRASSLGHTSAQFAPLAVIMVGLLALRALWDGWQRRQLLDRQSSLETIRGMSWQEFEQLVGEAYRRQGYRVEEVGGGGADGGVDLILRRDRETALVQCKRWKQAKVGAPTVRELRGAVARDGASRGIFVTSGAFTNEAKAEAKGQPLELVDGEALLELVKQAQGRQAAAPSSPTIVEAASAVPSAAPPVCPQCQSAMVLRTSQKGTNAGSKFWGCPAYPRCRGTRPV